MNEKGGARDRGNTPWGERELERERERERERKNILECLSTLSFKTKS